MNDKIMVRRALAERCVPLLLLVEIVSDSPQNKAEATEALRELRAVLSGKPEVAP